VISRRGNKSLILVVENDIAGCSPNGMSLEVNGILDDLSKFDRGPWNGSFRDCFGVQSVCFLQSFAGNDSAGTDFSKMERTTEQNQAVVVLRNHPPDLYMFVMTLEKASHLNSNVLAGEGIRIH
tara:strand:- start:4551 stop:4922 length:372 start_codon:yes stop_codon:yes gene_type:complete